MDNDPQDQPAVVQPDARSAPRAVLVLDPAREGAPLTGSVCNHEGKRCFAHVRATADGSVQPFDDPEGFTPSDLQDAYDIPLAIGGHPTIALVEAYGYDSLEADLSVYRAQFGLPPCTTATGCLRIVNQSGAEAPLPGPPPDDDDWSLEQSLDVDMASAACPSCNLLVIQANDDIHDGLELAQGIAVQLGASVISNSWGGPEKPGISLAGTEALFDQPVAVFAAAGDNGYDDGGQGPDYPGTSAHTIAVGATHLERAVNARGWLETAWNLGGSACSLSIAKPAYQAATQCTYKATTDIAAVGDPETGMASYDSVDGGWGIVGGTSASTPLIAAIFAATGNGGQTSGAFVEQNVAKLNDVISGTNGDCGGVLCTAGAGWDGPTGYGTPDANKLDLNPPTPGNPISDPGFVTGGCAASGPASGPMSGAGTLVLIMLALVPIRARARG